MGVKGREIVDLDVDSILKALKSVYADEWLAHYNYLHAAQILIGLNAPQVSSMLKSRAEQELSHALEIGQRILELGGELPAEWSDIAKLANCKSFPLPKSPSDIKAVLRSVLEAERCAILHYKELSDRTRLKDTVTHELMEDLLAAEVKDEEETENLLGED